jgi:hypothetical protein
VAAHVEGQSRTKVPGLFSSSGQLCRFDSVSCGLSLPKGSPEPLPSSPSRRPSPPSAAPEVDARGKAVGAAPSVEPEPRSKACRPRVGIKAWRSGAVSQGYLRARRLKAVAQPVRSFSSLLGDRPSTGLSYTLPLTRPAVYHCQFWKNFSTLNTSSRRSIQ